MEKLKQKILLFVFAFLVSATSIHALNISPSYTSSEHVLLGNKVTLYFSSTDPGQKGAIIHLANGLSLTYGEILSLPDFYEIVGSPIALAKNNIERNARFLAAFQSFAKDPNGVAEVRKIMDIIYDEMKMVDEGMKQGLTPEEIYKAIGHDNDRKYNCVTGGGCSSYTWLLFPGRYLKLAMQDYDHFGQNAWISYVTGHRLAIEQAVLAHQTGDISQLETAYAINAFACHFLSDRFAAGHIRTPRQEAAEHVTPSTVGSLVVNFMHEEENASSLHVHNRNGDHWLAYGDKSYFNQKNDTHREILDKTLQASADQVFAAYITGSPSHEIDTVYNLIPQADEVENMGHYDISPLFYWDTHSQNLMRRSEISNPYDRHWTANWWGWTTLIELQRLKGLTEIDQAQLALSNLAEKAVQDGLITNKEIVAFVKHRSRHSKTAF